MAAVLLTYKHECYIIICNHIKIKDDCEVRQMIREWIYNKLIQKRDKERHNVMKLEWQRAELERKIALKKSRLENC